MLRFIIGLALIAMGSFCLAQTTSFNFRDDHRPAFEKKITPKQLQSLQANSDVQVIDVRLVEDFAASPVFITGAQYRDPEDLPSWISQLDSTKEVVVYCVAGKWVSQKVAYLLNQAGISVQSLEGGVDAWESELSQ